jgi:hypothetical protein
MLRTQTGAEEPVQSVIFRIRGCVGPLAVSMHEIPQRTSVCGGVLGTGQVPQGWSNVHLQRWACSSAVGHN